MHYIVPERQKLFNMARIMYRDKLLHGSGIRPVLVSSTHPVRAEDIQLHGWRLKRPPAGTPRKFGWGCAPPPPPPAIGTLTLFETKVCDFRCPISDLTQNSIPYFRPDPYPISYG